MANTAANFMRWSNGLWGLSMSISVMACKRHEHPEISAKLVEVTPDAIIVEVTTKPGLEAGFGTTIDKGRGTVVGANGKARIELLMKRASGWDGTGLQIVAAKSSTFLASSTWMDLKMPCPTKVFGRIQPAEDGVWFALLGSEPRASKSTDAQVLLQNDDDVKPPVTVWLDPKEKTVPLVIATPGDAKLKIANRAVEVEPSGLTVVSLPTGDLVLGAEMDKLAKGTLRLPVRVGDKSFTLALRASADLYVPRLAAVLAKRLEAVADGETLKSDGTVDAVLLATTDGRVLHAGASGPASRAKWIGVAKGTRRNGKNCAYRTLTTAEGFDVRMDYEDWDVQVLEASTGKEVAKHKFVSPAYTCPVSASEKDEIIGRPDDETVTAWLAKALANGWK